MCSPPTAQTRLKKVITDFHSKQLIIGNAYAVYRYDYVKVPCTHAPL